MALLIPDAEGIYTDQEPPKHYDPVLGAYKETEGYKYNHGPEAWCKVWPAKLYLYKDGDECTDVTGGWNPYPLPWFSNEPGVSPSVTRGTEMITLRQQTPCRGSFWTQNMIDMTQYSVLRAHIVSVINGSDAPNYGGPGSRISSPKERKQAYGGGGAVLLDGQGVTKKDFVAEADIKNVNGEAYVAFGMDAVSGTIELKFDKVWLE